MPQLSVSDEELRELPGLLAIAADDLRKRAETQLKASATPHNGLAEILHRYARMARDIAARIDPTMSLTRVTPCHTMMCVCGHHHARHTAVGGSCADCASGSCPRYRSA